MSHSSPEERDLVSAARAEAEGLGVQASPAFSTPSSGEAPGEWIDRYKLLEQIGEGGMGTVWLAQQAEPVKRKVALKIIKLGMDTREVVLRFEAERQALALMDHDHIAKVLDGGATQNGRPFFVMELVRGSPITEYCDRAKLGLRERLELFTKVCEAIQHAHHKGVIHRDIKPSNVLVTLYDGKPVPKVIDFGIAKATSAELTQKTLFTRYAQVIGTPEYMAPEQAEQSGLDIDTRADVYSLGVLLYELLTGTKPFDIRTAREAGYDEILRMIREVDPAKPSTRVSTMGADATPIAASRHVNVGSLSSRLRGDLDWIVMKALDKDRTRRYETVNGFAVDIGRYLNQEPVVAAPPSATYRLRKFVRRRRATVTAAVVIAILVVGGSVGTGIGWWNTVQANHELDVALSEKSAALVRVTEQRERAEDNEKRARDAEQAATREAERASAAEAAASQRAAELTAIQADLRSLAVSSLNAAESKLRSTPGLEPFRNQIMEESFATLERLHARVPEDKEIREYLAISARLSANQMVRTNKRAEGQQRMELALRLQRQIVNEAEDPIAHRHQLAQMLRDLGSIQSSNDLIPEARSSIEESIAITEELRKLDRDDMNLDRTEGLAQLASIGPQWESMDLEAALKAAKSSVELLGIVVRQDFKTDADITSWLLARAWEGRVTDESGDYAGARTVYEKAIGQARSILGQKPGSRNFQYCLSRLLHWDARSSVRGEAPPDADDSTLHRAEIDEAVEMMARLHTDYPESEGFHANYADALVDQALIQWRHAGTLEEALATADQAIEVSSELLEANESLNNQAQLAHGLLTKAMILLEADREEAGTETLSESTTLLESVTQQFPASLRLKSAVERAHDLREAERDK